MNNMFKFLNRNKKYNILILGSDGMLGYDVYNHFKKLSTLSNSNIRIVTGITKADGIDVTKPYALDDFFQTSIHYDYCINCIAYTDTNKAENTKDGYNKSYTLNALAPEFIASSCNYWNVKLIHISTDYVFSEHSAKTNSITHEYELFSILDSTPFPINVYGTHKLLGEYGIERSFKNKKNYCILRTSWLFGMHNNKSFIHKFMKNVVKACMNDDPTSKGPITVEVNYHECSIPTSTKYVIDCIERVIENKDYGITHAVPMLSSSDIIPSRADFAKEILKWFGGEIVNGIDLSDVEVNDLTVKSEKKYWPLFSAMKTSFCWTASWTIYLEDFLVQNKKSILEYAIKESTK